MQIVCNHCGNQLSFPDYQNLVTCNHCATHLQIEETEQFYSASIIEKQFFEDLLKENLTVPKTNIFLPVLKDLLELEAKRGRVFKKTAFFAFLSWRKERPMLLRIFYRFTYSLWRHIYKLP